MTSANPAALASFSKTPGIPSPALTFARKCTFFHNGKFAERKIIPRRKLGCPGAKTPTAFTCFLAGAGVKKGFHYGVTDEIGYFVAENKVTIPDFHATILHLLGLNHEKLSFYHNGINRRLTDVHGEVIRDILS